MTAYSEFSRCTAIAIVALTMIVSGCASTAPRVETAADIAPRGDSTGSLVFGKLRLIRNGAPVALGDGLAAKSATLSIEDAETQRAITGRIGPGGEFSWLLPPGDYALRSIEFRYFGRPVKPETDFRFTVADTGEPTYLGTLTVEAFIDSGYLGVQATVDRLTVSDECAKNCDRVLADLGLNDRAPALSLLRWRGYPAGQ